MAEYVRDDPQLVFLAHRAIGRGFGPDVLRRPDQLGVGIADLGPADPAETNLVDEHPTGQTMVDDAAALLPATQRSHGETHRNRVPIRQTGPVTTPAISFGRSIPDDAELRLCGDLSGGKRALELGISRAQNSLAFALAGAKAIAVDPDEAAIEALRGAAKTAEVTVECHVVDLADLGFATSASIELVLADHTIAEVDDLGRLLRQVHRLLKSSKPFVISVPHPFAGVHSVDEMGSKVLPYGSVGRTIGDWHIQLSRAGFLVDRILELGVTDISPIPTTLLIRATKSGD